MYYGIYTNDNLKRDRIKEHAERINFIHGFRCSQSNTEDSPLTLGLSESLFEHNFLNSDDHSILLNGELYNDDRFKEEGGKKSSLNELLNIFRNTGIKNFAQLNGDFSIVWHDIKNNCLYLIINKFGPQNIYFTQQNNILFFSSKLKILVDLIGLVPSIEPRFLSKYFAYGFVPSPNTLFQGINKIPLGNYLSYKDNKGILTPYWNIKFNADIRKKHAESDYAKGLYSNLLEATRKRLNPDAQNGVFLSGGLDSSSMVAALSNFIPSSSIKTFTAAFNEKSFDESKNAKIVSAYFQTDHHEILFTPNDALKYIEKLLSNIDDPFSDDDVICGGLLSPYASEHVSDVFLGDGPDELLMGYPSFFAHKITDFYEKMPSPIQALTEQLVKHWPVSYRYRSFDSQFKQFIGGKGHPQNMRDAAWWGPFPPQYQEKLFHQDANQEINLNPENVYGEIEEVLSTVNADNYIDQILSIYIKILSERWLLKLNTVSHTNMLKFKMPYFDCNLIDYANTIPSKYKLKSKYILRKALDSHLPHQIVYGKKRPFFMPLAKWMKNDFRSLILETLSKNTVSSARLLNYPYISKMIENHLNGNENNAKQIWNILIFISWYKNLAVSRPAPILK